MRLCWSPYLQAQVAELALERETKKLDQAQAQLQTYEQQLSAAKQHATKHVALIRWQWAGTAAHLPHMQDPFHPPLPFSLKGQSSTELVKQVWHAWSILSNIQVCLTGYWLFE